MKTKAIIMILFFSFVLFAEKKKPAASKEQPPKKEKIETAAPVAATPPATIPPPIEKNYEVITIKDKVFNYNIKMQDKTLYFKALVAIGRAATISFPDDIKIVGTPTIGNDKMLRDQIIPAPLELKIWGMKFKEDTDELEMEGQSCNYTVKLNTGQTLVFEITIVAPQFAVSVINFSFSEFEKQIGEVKKYWIEKEAELKKKEDEIRANIRKEAVKEALGIIAEDFGNYYMCNFYDVRGNSGKELVFFMSDRICKYGDDKFTVNFVVRNGSRQYFFVEDVKIYKNSADGTQEGEIAGAVVKMSKKGLLYDEEAKGGISFILPKTEYSRSYTLELIENTGRLIKIPIEIGF